MRVVFKEDVLLRDLKKITRHDALRILQKIKTLEDFPATAGVKSLKGTHVPLYRLRIGDYRAAFIVRQDPAQITIVAIAHRKEIYRYLERGFPAQED